MNVFWVPIFVVSKYSKHNKVLKTNVKGANFRTILVHCKNSKNSYTLKIKTLTVTFEKFVCDN